MMLLQRHTGGGWGDVITETYRGWGGVMLLQRHTGGGWGDVITETYREGVG